MEVLRMELKFCRAASEACTLRSQEAIGEWIFFPQTSHYFETIVRDSSKGID